MAETAVVNSRPMIEAKWKLLLEVERMVGPMMEILESAINNGEEGLSAEM